jgi:hypothetical protein
MILADVPYLVSAFTTLLLPQYAHPSRFLTVFAFGELPMVLWLLIWGAKERPLGGPASSPAGG